MEFDLELHGNYLFMHLGRGSSEHPRAQPEIDQSCLATSGDRISRVGCTGAGHFVGNSSVAESRRIREEISECAYSPYSLECFTDKFRCIQSMDGRGLTDFLPLWEGSC